MASQDLFDGLHATTSREAFSGIFNDFRVFTSDRTFKSFREFIGSSIKRFQDIGMINLPAYIYESEIDARIYATALEQVFNREFPVSKIQDKWQVWFGVEVKEKLNDPQLKATVEKMPILSMKNIWLSWNHRKRQNLYWTNRRKLLRTRKI